MGLPETEPAQVQEARRVIREWELRNGHDTYVDCLDGGWGGFQAVCWDCDWRGEAQLRGSEPLGTMQSRSHKKKARKEAAQHREETAS